MHSIGIDLGTTNSAVSIFINNRIETLKTKNDSFMLPSFFSLNKKTGEVVIGSEAENLYTNIEWITVKSVKSILTEKLPISFKKEKYTPEVISSLYLARLKEIAEEKVNDKIDEVTITIPVAFGNKERKITKSAAKLAGFKKIHLLHEPSAASLDFVYKTKSNSLYGKNFVIYDFGGGTFDVSLAKVLDNDGIEIISNSGDLNLGGDNIDEIVFEFVKNEYNDWLESGIERSDLINVESALLESAKIAKENLSFDKKYEIIIPLAGIKDGIPVKFTTSINNHFYEELIKDIIEETVEHVATVVNDFLEKEKNSTIEKIDRLILVGGSTRIPLVRKTIAEMYNIPIVDDLDVDLTVSRGAAIKSSIDNKQIDDLNIQDIVSLDLGILGHENKMHVIIGRNSKVPVSEKRIFTTDRGINEVSVDIYQGQNETASLNRHIGKLELTDLGLDKTFLTGRVIVTFTIDEDGILTIKVLDRYSGRIYKKELDGISY